MSILFALLFLFGLIMLPIALIKPTWATKGVSTSRKKTFFLYLGATILFAALTGATAPPPTTKPQVAGEIIKASTPPQALVQENKDPQPTTNPTSIPTAEPVVTPSPKPTVKPTTKPVQQAQKLAQPATSGFSCNCSKTCPNMSSCAEAQYQLNECGCSARDADHDGIACDADCQ